MARRHQTPAVPLAFPPTDLRPMQNLKPFNCWRRPGSLTLGAILILTFSGCVASGYKLAPKAIPPAVPLNLGPAPTPDPAAVQPAPDVTLDSVIFFRGPGSWKRDAYWDEYVLTLANRGTTTLTVDSATLTDFQGVGTTPGASPWVLEKQSRSYEASIQATAGNILKIGGGYAMLGGMAFATGATLIGPPAFVTSGIVGTAAAVAVIPLFAAGTIYANVHSKHLVENQFTARRVNLPLTLAPGQSVHGSLFFRITPGPQRLTFHSTATGSADPRDVIIPLTPLAGLHLKPASDAAQNP